MENLLISIIVFLVTSNIGTIWAFLKRQKYEEAKDKILLKIKNTLTRN